MKVVKVGVTKIAGHRVKEVVPLDTEAKIKLANRMRKNPTKSERRLCERLAAKRYRFMFQHLMFGYIADFYFPGRKWIVELDGEWHRPEKDAHRDRVFENKGIKTLRIPASAMFTEPKMVVREIEQTVRPGKCRHPKKRERVRKLTKDHLEI